MIERNTQHIVQAVLKLAPAFHGKPRIASILVAIMRQVQELSDAIVDVIESRTVETDDPSILSVIGKIVGQERGPLSLEEFRTAIKARIRIYRSHGRLKDLIEVLKLWGVDATITPLYPAHVRVDLTDGGGDLAGTYAEHLSETVAAGVGLSVMHGPESAECFTFTNNSGAPTSQSYGAPMLGVIQP